MKLQISRSSFVALVALALVSGLGVAHDYVPGAPQSRAVLLKGGDVYTVANGVMSGADVLFENGRISQVGVGLSATAQAEIVDVTGMRVYPGLILPLSGLGLIEIGAVRATNDLNEVGSVTPEVSAKIAYNPDSEVIPTIRSNGILVAQITPGGDLIAGRSDLMNLDGWTREDSGEKFNVGLHVDWPRVGIITAWWMDQTPDEQRKNNDIARKRLVEVFDKAKSYDELRRANPNAPVDQRWEAMRPVFHGELPLFISAGDYRQIEEAVEFAQDYGLHMVLVGGEDAWQVTELLTKNNIPVILNRTMGMPPSEDADYDQAFKMPKLLTDAGVKFCLSYGDGATWDSRNFPFQGGYAVANGLSENEALRAITLSVAEILGVENDLGSIEVGKKATIVVSRGDIMDIRTNDIVHAWIGGKKVDLNNRQKELYEKYRQKRAG